MGSCPYFVHFKQYIIAYLEPQERLLRKQYFLYNLSQIAKVEIQKRAHENDDVHVVNHVERGYERKEDSEILEKHFLFLLSVVQL